LLLGEILHTPGLFERLTEVLRPGKGADSEPVNKRLSQSLPLRN